MPTSAKRYALSDQGAVDIDDIELYLAAVVGKAHAEELVGRLYQLFALLAVWPNMGRHHIGLRITSRIFPVSSWLVLYELLPRNNGIRILRVLDMRRDIESLLYES